MRTIEGIVLHASGGPRNQSVTSIKRHWKEVNHWDVYGYHHLIEENGKDNYLVPIERVSNGVRGFNKHIINICTIGGLLPNGKYGDTRTLAQIETLLKLVEKYKKMFPHAPVHGHRDYSTDLNGNGIIERWEWIKECPCYDVRDWFRSIGKEYLTIPANQTYQLKYPLIKDSETLKIQQSLTAAGYRVTDDGIFGKQTHDAVVRFQKARGLDTTGIVDYNTFRLLVLKHYI